MQFTQLAQNEKYSSPLDTITVDRRPEAGEGRKYPELLRAREAMWQTRFHHTVTGNES
jgi:hypothetical protein